MRSRASLIREADRVFSLYVRNRGQRFGYNHCFTCGAYLPVQELQAGHFVPRRFTNTRWHPVNVWPQCSTCNVEKSGNIKIYERKLVSQFSQDVVDALRELSYRNDGLTNDEIRSIIKEYKSVDEYLA